MEILILISLLAAVIYGILKLDAAQKRRRAQYEEDYD